jgi:hypothetical protein
MVVVGVDGLGHLSPPSKTISGIEVETQHLYQSILVGVELVEGHHQVRQFGLQGIHHPQNQEGGRPPSPIGGAHRGLVAFGSLTRPGWIGHSPATSGGLPG